MASILITGANRGIGLAAALIPAKAGHTLHATSRQLANAAALKKAAENENLKLNIFEMDVTRDDSVGNTIATIQQLHGPIEVLVNNAGIACHGSIEELQLEEIKSVMDTNYLGAIRCIQAVLPQMRKRRQGHIVNITSVAGRLASPPLSAYAASKFALEAISEALAAEVKPHNIHVSIIEPGIIETDMARSITHLHHESIYPHSRRFASLFSAALENPVSADLIGEKIKEILDTNSWKLRHPVGPDAERRIQWRASMTDEQWVDHGALSDEAWYQMMEDTFGRDFRPKNEMQVSDQ